MLNWLGEKGPAFISFLEARLPVLPCVLIISEMEKTISHPVIGGKLGIVSCNDPSDVVIRMADGKDVFPLTSHWEAFQGQTVRSTQLSLPSKSHIDYFN